MSFDGSANINLPGVNTTGNQNTTGSAATLTTARTIGGVSFDGSANINLPGVNTTGNQNTTGSAATLTTARTIGGVSFDGSANINLPGVNTTGNQNTTGSAATLTTARTIGGVSFDGSANIDLPGVNTTGNQNTTGNAATATTAGTVTTASQPNITSVGTLSSLTVSGDATFDTNTLFVDASENSVGIGTTTPNAPLEIHGGAGSGDEVLILSNSGDDSYTGLHAIFLDGGHHYDVYNSSTIQAGKSTSNGSNYHMNRYSAGDVTMCFGGGNVGIGDQTPSYKLDVAGDINLTGTISVSGTDLGLEHLSNASVSGNEITLGLTSTTGILPAQTGTVDLGSSANKFDVLYASKLNNGVTFTLPTADGTSGQFLKTDGSGTLSWGTASGSGASALNDLSDVSTSGAQTNYALVYNGSSWAPAAQSGSSSSSSSSEYYSAHIQNISDIDRYSGYIVSASSTYSSTYPPEYGFSHIVGTNDGEWVSANNKYSSGSYVGSESTNGYNGEWLQINFGKKVKVYSYSITGQYVSNTHYRAPGGYKMFGSNDGSAWTEVHSGSASLSDYSGSYSKTKDNTLSTPVTYQYFRLVVNSTAGSTTMTSIVYLSLKGTFEEPDLIKGAISTNVVHQRMTEPASLTLPSNGKTEIEALRLTITPQSSFSKLEINYSIGVYEVNTYNFGFVVSRTVGGTETFFTPGGNDGVNDMTFGVPPYGDSDYNSTPYSDSFSMIDEPNTTGVVVYKIYGKLAATTGSKTLYINRTITDSTSEGYEDGISTSSVKEFSTFTHNIAEQKVQGRVLETLAGVCDGRTVTVSSGTYTLTNVISTQNATTSWADVTGSSISYTPPSGTKQVVFEFHTGLSTDTDYGNTTYDGQGHVLVKMLIDGTSVTSQNQEWGHAAYAYADNFIYRGIIDITGTDDVANGKLSSWTSNKTIKLQFVAYVAHYVVRLHANRAGNLPTSNADVNTLIKPRVKITAIGEENLVYNLTNQYSITEGQVLETLAGVCDGRTVSGSSGTYTLGNVTSVLQVGTTYVDLTGSNINYKPPTGTKQIFYKFNYFARRDASGDFLYHVKVYVDNVECSIFNHSEGPINYGSGFSFTVEAVFDIGQVNDATNGKFLTWDTNKEIKIMVREYDSINTARFHEGQYFDGTATYPIFKPRIEITAIGRGVIEGTIGNLYSSKVNMDYINYAEPKIYSGVTTSGTELDVFRLNIKPVHRDSIIDLNYNIHMDASSYNWDIAYIVSRTVGGTETLLTKDPSNSSYHSGYSVGDAGQVTGAANLISFKYYDKPETLEMITYKITVKSTNVHTQTVYINRVAEAASGSSNETGISTVSATELPQQTTLHNPRYNSVIEQEGQVLETLAGLCDGRTVTVSSGTYTLPKVIESTLLSSTSTWVDIPGSIIDYKPPPGTKQVVYMFNFQYAAKDTESGTIFTVRFKIDDVEVTTSYIQFEETRGDNGNFKIIIDIGNVSSDDIANAKLASWNSTKKLEVSMCIYNTSYETYINSMRYGDVSSSGQDSTVSTNANLRIPRLEIQAIGRKSDTTFLNSFFNERKGQVLETLSGVCDGRTIEVDSGAYTLQNVTAAQDLGLSYTVITGSSVNYKPPSGTRQLIYKFFVTVYGTDGSSSYGNMFHYKLRLDGTYITNSNVTRRHGGIYEQETYCISYTIDIGGTDDIANGKIASWNEPKIIEVHARDYDTNHEVLLHRVSEMDGSGSYTTVIKPRLEITAIGDAAIQNATVVAGNSMVHFQGYSKTFNIVGSERRVQSFQDMEGNTPLASMTLTSLKNFGDCMNTTTGVFTTPHNGLYSINMVTHQNGDDNGCWIELVVDGKFMHFGDTKGSGYNSNSDVGPSITLYIETGKEIYLRIGTINNYGIDSAPYNGLSFSITALQDRVPQAISARPGMTLETLAGQCDGQSITVSSGTYTIPSVTQEFELTTSYQDIPGTSISYKPPAGTHQVIYNFYFAARRGTSGSNMIGSFKLFLDSTEVTAGRKVHNGPTGAHMLGTTYKFIFNINGTDDIANGKLSSWDTLKTLKLQAREYGSNDQVIMFRTYHWEGSNSAAIDSNNIFVQPSLEIQAIGDGPGIVPSTGMNVVKTTYSTQTNFTVPTSIPGINISGLNLTIKPTGTDSVIEIKFNLFAEADEPNICFRITRNIDGTDVLVVPASNNWEGAIQVPYYDGQASNTPGVYPIVWYDEPNTTSAVTYKLWAGSSYSLDTKDLYVNRTYTQPGQAHHETGVSSAIAIEYPKTARPLDTENALTIPPFVGATNKEKLYNQDGDLYFNGKQLSNEWYKNGGDLYRLGANVGIGKSSPAYKLDVLGDINFTGSLRRNGIDFGIPGLWAGSTNVYRSTGMVGIGTSTFVDTVRNAKGIHIANSSGISFLANTGVADSRNWRIRHDDLADWGSLQFTVSSDNSSAPTSASNNVMTMLRSGHVGIGTTSPFGKLDIKHSNWTQTPTASTMCDMLNLMVSSPSTTGEGNMRTLLCFADGYRNDSATKDSYRVRCRMSGAGFDMIWNSSATETIGTNTSNNNFIFHRDYTAFMNENVGIGKTSPEYKLHIANETINNSVQDLLCLETHCNASVNGPAILFRERWNNGAYWNVARIAGLEEGGYGGRLAFYTNEGTGSADNNVIERMRIDELGKVGIGTTSPASKLEVTSIEATNTISLTDSVFSITESNEPVYGRYGLFSGVLVNAGEIWMQGGRVGSSSAHTTPSFLPLNILLAPISGNVGIGTTSPNCPLYIEGSSSLTFTRKSQLGDGGVSTYSGLTQTFNITLNCRGYSLFKNAIFNESDSRIKKNIEDVPDNLALEQVRNIPCRYYEYIDKFEKGEGKTIGFIAQEVKNVLPMAVTMDTQIIPNVYKIISCEWSGNVMYSQELGTVSGIKYKFYVGEEQEPKTITGSSDNTFTFEQQWTNVFCYGHEVKDFHILDKNKLFALNFSATQELDRQQQADKAKIASLETKVQTLETTLASQQTLIQSLMTRLEALENP